MGWSLAANRKDHPKIPNYEIQNIPRDPGETWAYALGVGMAKTEGPFRFAADLFLEPIRSDTWADAASDTTDVNGKPILAGEKTIENDFLFTNALIRTGGSWDYRQATFRGGLQVRSISYELDQFDRIQVTKRNQDESWMEWTPSIGASLKLSGCDRRWVTRITTGTGTARDPVDRHPHGRGQRRRTPRLRLHPGPQRPSDPPGRPGHDPPDLGGHPHAVRRVGSRRSRGAGRVEPARPLLCSTLESTRNLRHPVPTPADWRPPCHRLIASESGPHPRAVLLLPLALAAVPRPAACPGLLLRGHAEPPVPVGDGLGQEGGPDRLDLGGAGKAKRLHGRRPRRFNPVQAHQLEEDNGQDLTSIRISDDGEVVVFVRGHTPNSQGWVANPNSDPRGAERAIWAMSTRGGRAVEGRGGERPGPLPGRPVGSFREGRSDLPGPGEHRDRPDRTNR